jgi:hypothetical protein
MSSWLASLTGQPALVAVGAGLLAGAVTGTTLVVTGTIPDRPDPQLTILTCYHDGVEIGDLPAGQSILVTGRSADAAWLEVYLGVPGAERGWAPANALRLAVNIDALPLADCVGFIAPATAGPPPSLLPSIAPSPTPSAAPTVVATVAPTPSPSPTPGSTPRPTRTLQPTAAPTPTPTPVPTPSPTPVPTPTPTPTPVPDTTPPTITGVSITGTYQNGINYYIDCQNEVATISITITDSGGSGLNVSSIRLRWTDPLGTQHSQPMSSQGSNRYASTITFTFAWPNTPKNIPYWITARDNAGNLATSTSPPDSQHWLFQEQFCD